MTAHDPLPHLRMTVWRPVADTAHGTTLGLSDFSWHVGLHPEMVRRFVVLGLLDATRQGDDLRFEPDQLTIVGRIQRLRAGLSLNYAAIGLVLDLLDRIDRLESALTTAQTTARLAPSTTVVRTRSVRSWT